MSFTDIFIKRPVLSVVVSLLILLIGLRAATVLVMGMLTPSNPSSATISATANPSVPPPKK